MPPELVDVLRTLVEEEAERRRVCDVLSEREREVLVLLDTGKSNAEIADALSIAPTTVRTHLEHIYRKLDVHSRTAALARAAAQARRSVHHAANAISATATPAKRANSTSCIDQNRLAGS